MTRVYTKKAPMKLVPPSLYNIETGPLREIKRLNASRKQSGERRYQRDFLHRERETSEMRVNVRLSERCDWLQKCETYAQRLLRTVRTESINFASKTAAQSSKRASVLFGVETLDLESRAKRTTALDCRECEQYSLAADAAAASARVVSNSKEAEVVKPALPATCALRSCGTANQGSSGGNVGAPKIVKNQRVIETSIVSKKDVGSYKCIATNEAGQDEHIFKVKIKAPATEPPQIDKTFRMFRATAKYPFALNCKYVTNSEVTKDTEGRCPIRNETDDRQKETVAVALVTVTKDTEGRCPIKNVTDDRQKETVAVAPVTVVKDTEERCPIRNVTDDRQKETVAVAPVTVTIYPE
ncbi:hypothetical protein MSG28_016226 [Choristoneura fumiferana]|uniref:Uncharacterized protein n=1 Tax=Choristoneura fumiferana TaxID=7141 RepID=A0ACC0K6N0_CHOFU|nr:hypothetical protein MSG28_016226 [Choristoneura fumiferana]